MADSRADPIPAQALIAKWRKQAAEWAKTGDFAAVAACQAARSCADQLEAALAKSVEPQC